MLLHMLLLTNENNLPLPLSASNVFEKAKFH